MQRTNDTKTRQPKLGDDGMNPTNTFIAATALASTVIGLAAIAMYRGRKKAEKLEEKADELWEKARNISQHNPDYTLPFRGYTITRTYGQRIKTARTHIKQAKKHIRQMQNNET